MSLWGLKRQVRIAAVFFLFALLPVAALVVYLLWERPTCDDGRQNGGETGVDCGGSCLLVCSAEANAALVAWARRFEVSPGRYNVVSYVENPNVGAEARDVPYRFRLLDPDGVPIATREGTVTLRPLFSTPIVENGLATGARAVSKVEFAFLASPVWQRAAPREPVVVVADERLSADAAEPRVVATVENVSLFPIRNLFVVAIVYDATGNAVGASRTVVERLEPDSRQTLTFTWAAPFSPPGASIEIVPLYDAPGGAR